MSLTIYRQQYKITINYQRYVLQASDSDSLEVIDIEAELSEAVAEAARDEKSLRVSGTRIIIVE